MNKSMEKSQSQLTSSRGNTYSNGLREYLQATSQCDYVKKRIKILAHFQAHNLAKTKYHQESLQKLENIRIEKEKNQNEKSEMKEKKKMTEEERRFNNSKYKNEMKNRISEVLREIQEEKRQDRMKIRQQSKHIAQKIHQNKEKQLQEKRQKRNRVLQIQNQSKQNYKIFHETKKEDLSKQNQLEISRLHQKRNQKYNQIKKMSMIQLDLITKQSQTKKQCDTVRLKLSQIYNVQKEDKSLRNK